MPKRKSKSASKRGSKEGTRVSKKGRVSEEGSEEICRAPIPFDVYLRSLDPEIPFHNNNGDCADEYSPEYNRENLLVQLAVYAHKVGLGPMLDPDSIYLNSKIERFFSTFITRWQAHAKQSIKIFDLVKTHLPPLTRPLVLYRGYNTGIDGEQPEVGQTWDMGLRSCSLSQGFADAFFTSSHANSFVARIDVMQGLHVLPLLHYGHEGLLSEFEILVEGNLRVHVLDPSLVPEGRTEMPPPPMDYKCPDKYFLFAHTENLKRIQHYFVLSLPGTTVEYYPNFEDRSTVRVGGGKPILLTDRNSVGTGKPEAVLRSYLAKKKRVKRSVRRPPTF